MALRQNLSFPVEKLLQLLIRILDIPEFLGKNLGKIPTKKSTNLQDLARSCQEIQEKNWQKWMKTNKNWRQPQLFALPTKLSRSEIQYFV